MIVGSVLENRELEQRIAVTPETSKKYKSMGIKVYLTKGYASHVGISDEEYKKEIKNERYEKFRKMGKRMASFYRRSKDCLRVIFRQRGVS